MPSTKKKTPSTTTMIKKTSPNRRSISNKRREGIIGSPVRMYRRTSPLWKNNITLRKKSPQPQPPQISSTEIFRMQLEKWKEEQERLKHLTRRKWMKNIHENRQKGLYIDAEPQEKHVYFSNQQPSNFWVSAQQQLKNDLDWASGDVPHFGGRKRRHKK